MEFFTLDEDGVHCGMELRVPFVDYDNFRVDVGLQMDILRDIRTVRPEFRAAEGARYLLGCGNIRVVDGQTVVSRMRELPAVPGSAVLVLDLVLGLDDDGEEIPLNVSHGYDTLPLGSVGEGDVCPKVYLLMPGASIRVTRRFGVYDGHNVPSEYIVTRLTNSRQPSRSLRPAKWEATGWLVRPKGAIRTAETVTTV